jgi:hypothetical protein
LLNPIYEGIVAHAQDTSDAFTARIPAGATFMIVIHSKKISTYFLCFGTTGKGTMTILLR